VNSLLYVPTNRQCEPAIRYGVAECAALRDRTGAGHVFLLVEHQPGHYTRGHAELVRSLGQSLSVPVMHLTASSWLELSATIVRATGAGEPDQRRLHRLLNPRGTAYGAGPNKAYLVAAALGAENLYRRDSDHLPDYRDGEVAYPAILESAVIGRTLREAGSLANAALVRDDQWDKTVYCVGSSMFGDAPLDRRDLIACGEQFALDLQSLSHPGLSWGLLQEKMRNYLVDEPATRYDDDFYELDLTGRAEIGVSCVRQTFRELPEMPMPSTLGCDYLGKNLLYQLGLPVVFHSRKMRHDYVAARKEQRNGAEHVDYAFRDLRYLLLRRVWNAHNQNIRRHTAAFVPLTGLIDGERYAASFEACLSEIAELTRGIAPDFAAIHRRAARAADGALSGRLNAVADAIDQRGASLAGEVENGIRDYCWLVRWWPRLVQSACGTAEGIRDKLSQPTS
jgi:hypothetical protein